MLFLIKIGKKCPNLLFKCQVMKSWNIGIIQKLVALVLCICSSLLTYAQKTNLSKEINDAESSASSFYDWSLTFFGIVVFCIFFNAFVIRSRWLGIKLLILAGISLVITFFAFALSR